MKKLLKIYILFALFIFMLIPFVNSFAINMSLDSYENTSSDSNTTNSFASNEENVLEEKNSISNTHAPTQITTSSNSNGFLTIENILAVIIIVIGIILIFLAIAILIRFK